MFRPRIIPVLLLKNNGAVKTKQFRNPVYLGDIINTARIFSEFGADELIVLDIEATKEKRSIEIDLVKELSTETGMPLAVGGGIRSVKKIEQLLQAGAEKVILGTAAFEDPDFVQNAASRFGSSTISVCVDVSATGEIHYFNGSIKSKLNFREAIAHFVELGVGEIIVQSVANDGMCAGYDLETLKVASENSSVPIVALGGSSSLHDFSEAFFKSNCSACAASSQFVFHKSGVLISYPEKSQIRELFNR
jgi:cyclase